MDRATSGKAATKRDFDSKWDYEHPDASEKLFREMLEASNHYDLAYDLELQTQIARALGLQRKFHDAQRILEIVKLKIRPDMDRVRVRFLLEEGRLHNSSGHPQNAKPFFLEAFKLAERANEVPLAIDAAHMMGIVEPPEAQLSWSEKAMELAKASSNPDAKHWVGPLANNLGWTYCELGRYEDALRMFRLGVDSRQNGPDKPLLIARYCVAHALRHLGRCREALDILFDVERRFQQLEMPAPYTQEELGECLYALGLQEEAVPHFARAYSVLAQDAVFPTSEPTRLERLKRLGRVDVA